MLLAVAGCWFVDRAGRGGTIGADIFVMLDGRNGARFQNNPVIVEY